MSDYAKELQRRHWSFLGPGYAEMWYGTCNCKPEGKWDQQVKQMIEVFAQSGHPVFRGTNVLSRGTLKRKQGRNTIHFKADSENIELIMRTIHSANQLSIYGAVSSWCIDLSGRMQGPEFLGMSLSISEENEQLSQQLNPQEVGSLARSSPKTKEPRTLEKAPEEQLRTVNERAGFVRTVSKGMYYRTREMWTMDL